MGNDAGMEMSERWFGQGAGLGAATGPPVIDISLSVAPLKLHFRQLIEAV